MEVSSVNISSFEKIDKFSAYVVLTSLAIYFTQHLYPQYAPSYIDLFLFLYFSIEFIYKVHLLSWKKYISNDSHKFDFILLIVSASLIPFSDLDSVIYLRVFRLISIVRIFRIIPNGSQVIQGLTRAIRSSKAILILLFTLLSFFSLIGFSLFSNTVPEYFGTPLTSLNTVFEIFTVENWGELPNSIDKEAQPYLHAALNSFTIIVLVIGGFIAVSLANAVFVDELVSDNNEELKEEIMILKYQNEDLKKIMTDIQKEIKSK